MHERFPIIGQRADFVHGAFVEHHEWVIADRPRIAHAARIVDRDGGRVVTVAHFHGLRDPSGKGDSPARHGQAERLARLISAIRQPDDFVVACGDFNVLPDSKTFRTLAEVGLIDLVGSADTRTSRYTKPLRHANYLLVSDPGIVERFDAPAEPEVSDHRFLIVEI